jgi:hypothetical protein
VKAIKNFFLCWFFTACFMLYLAFSLLITMPFRFVFSRESFEWSKEHEAERFVEAMLEFTLEFREKVILKHWSDT